MSDGWSGFLHSIRRASNFKEVRPVLRTITFGQYEGISEDGRRLGSEDTSQSQFSDDALSTNGPTEQTPLLNEPNERIDDVETGSPLLRSKLNNQAYERVESINRQREDGPDQRKDDEREPLLIRKIERADGTQAEVIVGQSTLSQTIFNSSNVLIGVGMLSLPLGVRYAGWIPGIGMLVLSGVVTKYTANLLAKCLDIHSSLANFGDIAYVAFGARGRFITTIIFTFELTAACISLVILFADSLESLVDGPNEVHWKILCGCILAPLNFLPMCWLSFTSFLGIFCGILLIIFTFVAGFLKSSSPGSMLDVAATYALPQQWKAFPLSFGLLMAVWGGHSVFPNIYRDMEHPQQYNKGLNTIFSFVTSVDVAMAVVGYLMYGDDIKDEISTNILTTKTYPQWLRSLVLALIAIVPLTKFPLNCAPIVSTLEGVIKIDPGAAIRSPNRVNQSRLLTNLVKSLFRLLVTLIIVLLAIFVPSFELISALMGAAFCYLICIIMPAAFHLKMFHGQISRREFIMDWTLIVVSSVLAIAGTIWEFLPRSWMGL